MVKLINKINDLIARSNLQEIVSEERRDEVINMILEGQVESFQEAIELLIEYKPVK